MNAKTIALAEKLEKYPYIKARIEALFSVAENNSGDFDLADDAEEQLIKEIKKMGQEMLQAWADNQAEKKTLETKKSGKAIAHSKKNFTGPQRLDWFK